jgi:hypothetical protein
MKAHPRAVANVPPANESLVGRNWERAFPVAVLTGPNGRRLTLTWPEGVRKTLLARKIQADLGPDLEAAMDGLRGARRPYNLAHDHYLLGIFPQRRGDHAASLAYFGLALALCRDLGDTLGLAQCCEGMTPTPVALGWPERAARLPAAAESIRQTLAAPLPPQRQ